MTQVYICKSLNLPRLRNSYLQFFHQKVSQVVVGFGHRLETSVMTKISRLQLSVAVAFSNISFSFANLDMLANVIFRYTRLLANVLPVQISKDLVLVGFVDRSRCEFCCRNVRCVIRAHNWRPVGRKSRVFFSVWNSSQFYPECLNQFFCQRNFNVRSCGRTVWF